MNVQPFMLAISLVNLTLLGLYLQAAGFPGEPDPVLRGQALELVDAAGQVRSRLNVEKDGQVVFRLLDQRGTIRVKLGAGEDGSGLVLLDERTEPGIHLVARREAQGERGATSVTLRSGNRSRTLTP
ncbi:MAG TPA: hypothetical protein VFB61_07280 [Gemmatimonadales bacterium]|nr:hypothetical protein [Gemmatimonadales bacterium]